MLRRYYLHIAFVIFASALIGACAGTAAEEPTDDVSETATEPTEEAEEAAEAVESSAATDAMPVEGPLTVLCGMQEDWCQAAIPAFQEATGIDTSFVRMSSGEALARLRSEEGAPSFDVWYGGPSLGPGAATQEGLIEAYTPDNIDLLVDDELRDPEGIWTGVYLGALGFCSNPDLLEDLGVEAPTSWADLLDPAFDDNIAVADQRTSGTAVTAGGTLIALNGGQEGALDYLIELDENIFQYTKSGSSPGRMAAAGEVAVAIIFSHDCVKFAQETGVGLITSFPEEGTGYEIGQVSLIANANNPEAAKVFIEWALTAEAQEIAATVLSFQIPTNKDAEIPDEAVRFEDVVLALDFTPELVANIRAEGWPDLFADVVRNGADAPE